VNGAETKNRPEAASFDLLACKFLRQSWTAAALGCVMSDHLLVLRVFLLWLIAKVFPGLLLLRANSQRPRAVFLFFSARS
jgi:hypothetical protein